MRCVADDRGYRGCGPSSAFHPGSPCQVPPQVAAFGLALRYHPLGRLNVAALTVGFGAVTNIVWEIGGVPVLHHRQPERVAGSLPGDTIGDLTLSLLGAVVGAMPVSIVLWPPAGRRSVRSEVCTSSRRR